jgi:hypothetical protein
MEPHVIKEVLSNILIQHTLVRVISNPLMDVTMIIPTRMKEMCWDQNFTYRNREKNVKSLFREVCRLRYVLFTYVTVRDGTSSGPF